MSNLFNKILPEDVGKPVTGSTQEHIPIKAIHDDLVILNDGSAALVLQTGAVNFDLLSENEQLAIISSFAAMLNSLSFSIQIVIRSKRLDITHYIESIKKMEDAQTNPLLKEMTKKYRVFVETLTSENEVLDKQFYLVISVSYLEIGLVNNIEKDLQKAITLLTPRRDHIIKQLARIGLKATQLDNQKLIRLFYDFYNESSFQQDIRAYIDKSVTLKAPVLTPAEAKKEEVVASEQPPIVPRQPQIGQQVEPEHQQPPKIQIEPHFLKTRLPDPEWQKFLDRHGQKDFASSPPRQSIPFVVEELGDDFGTA